MGTELESPDDREPPLWQELGLRGPANRPGGPPVDQEQLRAFVQTPDSQSSDRREEISRLIATYAEWHAAFVQALRGGSIRD